MTIKICHDKTMNNLSKCGKVFSKVLQMFFLSWIPIGIYSGIIGFDNLITIMGIIFGILTTFVYVPLMRSDSSEYQTILHDINNKIKLFAWNEDC